jgi:hypothetical protein
MEEILRAAREGNEGEVVRLLDADPALLEDGARYAERPLVTAATGGHSGIVTRYLL